MIYIIFAKYIDIHQNGYRWLNNHNLILFIGLSLSIIIDDICIYINKEIKAIADLEI